MQFALARLHAVLLALCIFASAVYAESVMVPVADGTRLATHYHLPDGDGPWPVIVVRTVYGMSGVVAKAFTTQGYVVVAQYARGRFDSEGTDMVFADDGWGKRRDGADTLRWVRAQPWCNGKVGTWGPSALGITQVMLAGADKDIAAQCILVAASNFYDQVSYQGGVFRKNMIEKWLAGQKSLHVLDLWKRHPYYDEFWVYHDAEARAGEIGAPAIHYGGWFDIFAKGTVNNFVTRQYRGGEGARGNQKLVMGPWPHGARQEVGDLRFPDNFNFDLKAYQARFFEFWLKGTDNGIMNEPAIHYYVMGDCSNPDAPGNDWRTANDWPPVPTVETAYYLDQGGVLTTDLSQVRNRSVSFKYDPSDPCPTHGGHNLLLPAGPFDQRELSERADLLTFVTAPLPAPVECTGTIRVKLYVSSTAPDTDFTAKLLDVYPDGRQILITDGIQRVKLRNGFEKPDPLLAGAVGELDVDLWSTSIVLNTDHRIGVQISSSNFPRFEVNPNTGEDFPRKGRTKVADNTIYFGRLHPSAIVLPVRAAE